MICFCLTYHKDVDKVLAPQISSSSKVSPTQTTSKKATITHPSQPQHNKQSTSDEFVKLTDQEPIDRINSTNNMTTNDNRKGNDLSMKFNQLRGSPKKAHNKDNSSTSIAPNVQPTNMQADNIDLSLPKQSKEIFLPSLNRNNLPSAKLSEIEKQTDVSANKNAHNNEVAHQINNSTRYKKKYQRSAKPLLKSIGQNNGIDVPLSARNREVSKPNFRLQPSRSSIPNNGPLPPKTFGTFYRERAFGSAPSSQVVENDKVNNSRNLNTDNNTNKFVFCIFRKKIIYYEHL
ncbi:hypothetical protein RFI_06980 [Reticulomyxa filosa]|uniref:Uncharacterized protein n=1 Tax=Reticulomyxa filosa TaxID=46433 RepID=X6NWD8_RETFI|nr:hypothetical protein RFI_06980 [Reticulomyxa filosa]|eukprot:ETO30144.1 hypothetical protein RFI_06980 [Reticulomyxa filosa]